MSENSFSMVAIIPTEKPEHSRRLTVGLQAKDIHDFARWASLGTRLEAISGKEIELDWLILSLRMPEGLQLSNTNEAGEMAHLARLDINLPGVFWPTPNSVCFQFRNMLLRLQINAWPDEIRAENGFIQKRNAELGLMQPAYPPEIYTEFYAAADAAARAEEKTRRVGNFERTLKHLAYDAQALTVAEIAAQLDLSRQAVSKRVQSLVKRRWIRAPQPGWRTFTPDEAAIIATFPKGYKK